MAFSYYKTFTTDASQAGSADSSNFPITISVTDADLKTVANGGYVQNANGYDIRPYSDSGLTTALTFELVYYNASTGQVEMHVKVGTLSHTTNLVSYLAFGDATISTDGSSSSTWDSNFKFVGHVPNGTTLTLNDSTANANNGTLINTPTAVAGQLDGGMGLDSASSQYATLAHNAGLSPVTWTLSAWVKVTSFADYHFILDKDDSSGNNRNYGMDIRITTGKINVGFTTSGTTFKEVASGTGITAGVWSHAVGTFNGSTLAVYRDGAADGTLSTSSTPDTTTDAVQVGRIRSALYYFLGSVDEIRISNSARSASWITAEYNNQKASSTFLTWGSRTATTTLVPPSRFIFQAVNRAGTY